MWKVQILLVICSLFWSLDASCPSGWMRHNNACYHFSHDLEDWSSAMNMCHILGGTLVEIETAAENAFLASMAINFNENYWIALSDIQEEGVWVWMETNTPMSQTGYSNWMPGAPDNVKNNENCGTLIGINYDGHWNDWHCSSDTLQYICEKQDTDGVFVG
ncbi:perlucin-like protein [Ruditapes philippinarum]|uniref:perlucin-like protein n=1 Tax=Ruditapes philippinarum TaxID=129788 RepID=UPI00295A5DE9|nr:perlucin-like protein [Ruditapes philippinarum]